MIQLLGRATSGNVQKVIFMLEELRLPYERKDYGKQFDNTTTPEYAALNPMKKVPTLVDGDTVVWQSNTILRYLANKTGNTRWPIAGWTGCWPSSIQRTSPGFAMRRSPKPIVQPKQRPISAMNSVCSKASSRSARGWRARIFRSPTLRWVRSLSAASAFRSALHRYRKLPRGSPRCRSVLRSRKPPRLVDRWATR